MRGEAADPDSDSVDDTDPGDPSESVGLGLLTDDSLFDRSAWDSADFGDPSADSPNTDDPDTDDPMGAVSG